MTLDNMAKMIHKNAVEKGFWSLKNGEDQANQILAKMMLIDTEVSEMADAYVKMRGSEEITKECVDIIIRLLDLMEAMKIYKIVNHSIDDVIHQKIIFNESRPEKHNRLM